MQSVPKVLPDLSNRIATLDILRGIALFGMIFLHFHQEFRLTTEGVAQYVGEELVGYIAWTGVEQKAWGTFAFLFGVGFAVLMCRAEQRGQPMLLAYLRRLGALALIAVAMDALTGFTVLLEYALWGVPLLFMRKWPTALLLVIALLSAFAPQAVGRLMKTGLGIVNEQWLAFTYIGALTLLVAYRPQWTSRLVLFGVAGRMALTNYVTQCTVIFVLSSPFALGLHLRPYFYALGAIALFGVAVVFSHLWLSRFRYGPIEWMWRSATYLRVPPLMKA